MSKTEQARIWLKKLEECVTSDGKIASETSLFRCHETKILPNGARQFSYVEYTDDMYDFWNFLESLGYAKPFQYMEWMEDFLKRHDPENDMSWLETVDKDMLNKFLFCLRRRERFHTGLWASRLCNGYILRLFRRLLELENIS